MPQINMKNQNDTDFISAMLELDRSYIYQRNDAYYTFLTKWKKANQSTNSTTIFFMSLQENYLKTIHFITKNALVATILMLLALTTVTAAAAELAAPKEYKPSTILNLKSETKQVVQPVASVSSSSQMSSSSVSSQVLVQSGSSTPINRTLTSKYMPGVSISYSDQWSIIKDESNVTSNNQYMVNYELKNVKGSLYILAKKNNPSGGIGQYIQDYKRISPYLAREKRNWNPTGEGKEGVFWYYTASFDGSEIPLNGQAIGEDGCQPGEQNQEYKKPTDKYCGGAVFTKIVNEVVYNISYKGDDSLLSEVDQMVLNSGIQF